MSKMKYINWTCAIFPGFYESDLYNSDTLYNINYSQDEGDPELDFYEGGFDEYCQSVAKQAAELLACDLDQDQEIIKESRFVALHSPRFYNYETDKIECELDLDWPALLAWIKKNLDSFDEYLKNNFTSRDGFWSFVPNNAKEFFNDLDNDFDRLSQVIIEYYILEHLDLDLWREHLWEIASNTIYQYLEPVTTDDQQENKEVK